MENHNAKHFVLQLGSLISLYLSLSFLLVLIFGIINIMFPDAADYYWQTESARANVRIGIAMVIVFFPTYLALTRVVNKLRRTDTATTYLPLTKWLIYLSLLASGLLLLGDLVVVIMTFLEGEITIRFLLKAGAVLIVIGSAFYYYLLDAKGFWTKNERKSIIFASVASVIVIASVAFGGSVIETPSAVREQKLDEKQITDLQTIQWSIQDYYVLNQKLPSALSDLAQSSTLPEAPTERTPYTYKTTDNGFALCANFAVASDPAQFPSYPMIPDKTAVIVNPDSWNHDAGEVCFERVVNTLPETQ